MKDYTEYEQTAHCGRPFSNGTDWEVWQSNVCQGHGRDDLRCVNDGSIDDGGGCPLILLSLDDKTPAAWRLGRTPGCTEKTTAVEMRRAAKQAQAAADKAAHYPLFPEVPVIPQ